MTLNVLGIGIRVMEKTGGEHLTQIRDILEVTIRWRLPSSCEGPQSLRTIEKVEEPSTIGDGHDAIYESLQTKNDTMDALSSSFEKKPFPCSGSGGISYHFSLHSVYLYSPSFALFQAFR